MAAELRGKADFFTVYIEEAHPKDGTGYKFGLFSANGEYDVPEPGTLEERLRCADLLYSGATEALADKGEDPVDLPPLLLDSMDNALAIAFSAFPERLYIIQGGKVVYKGGEGPFFYDPEKMRAALDKILAASL